jgi:protoheme IX farnesyltransferase
VPVVAGARETRRQIAIYTLLLVPLSLVPWAMGFSGLAFGVAAAVLGVRFVWWAWLVVADRQDAAGVSLRRDAPAKAAFRYSIVYLFALFGALVVDRLVG